jgi:disulfide oxidoreductase YuzD
MSMRKIIWLDEPEEHDYPAARAYLTLLFPDETADALTEELKIAQMSQFKAKDIFRASRLSLLGVSNHHVQSNMDKVAKGKPLSPILLVRSRNLIIADGYHRLCAVYRLDEDLTIPCKIA